MITLLIRILLKSATQLDEFLVGHERLRIRAILRLAQHNFEQEFALTRILQLASNINLPVDQTVQNGDQYNGEKIDKVVDVLEILHNIEFVVD